MEQNCYYHTAYTVSTASFCTGVLSYRCLNKNEVCKYIDWSHNLSKIVRSIQWYKHLNYLVKDIHVRRSDGKLKLREIKHPLASHTLKLNSFWQWGDCIYKRKVIYPCIYLYNVYMRHLKFPTTIMHQFEISNNIIIRFQFSNVHGSQIYLLFRTWSLYDIQVVHDHTSKIWEVRNQNQNQILLDKIISCWA